MRVKKGYKTVKHVMVNISGFSDFLGLISSALTPARKEQRTVWVWPESHKNKEWAELDV